MLTIEKDSLVPRSCERQTGNLSLSELTAMVVVVLIATRGTQLATLMETTTRPLSDCSVSQTLSETLAQSMWSTRRLKPSL